MTFYVQFADDKELDVIATFGSPQNPDDYQNYGEIDDVDPRLTDYLKRLDPEVVVPEAEPEAVSKTATDEAQPAEPAAGDK